MARIPSISAILKEAGELRIDYVQAVKKKGELLDVIDEKFNNANGKPKKNRNGKPDDDDELGAMIDVTA